MSPRNIPHLVSRGRLCNGMKHHHALTHFFTRGQNLQKCNSLCSFGSNRNSFTVLQTHISCIYHSPYILATDSIIKHNTKKKKHPLLILLLHSSLASININPSRYDSVTNNPLYQHTTEGPLPTSLCFTLTLLIFDIEIKTMITFPSGQ